MAAARAACTVVFAAFGTRGDVQPVALVALELARALSADESIAFITHRQHAEWLPELSGVAALAFLFVDAPPAHHWMAQRTPVTHNAHCNQCLSAACAALGMAQPARRRPQQQQQQQQLHARRLVAFNLFALEFFHIAEALGLRAAALSPCVVPYKLSPAFEPALRRAYPALADALDAAGDGGGRSGGDDGGSGGEDGGPQDGGGHPVTWAVVSHWLWPLFTQRWSAFRQDALGLGPCPFIAPSGAVLHAQLARAPALLYGVRRCARGGGRRARA
jgi:hypothetical protein